MKLAINGGRKIRTRKFPAYVTIGKEEEKAVKKVLRSAVLSRFLGTWHDDFYGGHQIQSFEKEWARYFKVKNAIAVNSATSGLYCAVGACGVGPGDEVIVSPFTMTVSAAAPLIYNAIPVFADIEDDYFCLDPKSVESRITRFTKAIIVVDIFGQPYDADKINAIARKHDLFIIEDAAQAPGAKYKGRFCGTLGDIGVYSLNYHKHIHTGEGGVVVTDDDKLADKIRLIRNHAEAVLAGKGFDSLVNMIGFNYRMTEIEAAIGREQLRKLEPLLLKRIENVEYLSERLSRLPCLEPAKVRSGCSHSFYVHPVKYNYRACGVKRDKFIEAVKAELAPIKLREAEGVKISIGFKPLYLQPLYQNMTVYGSKGCPWNCDKYKGKVAYKQGICPVSERMFEEELMIHEYMRPGMEKKDLDDIFDAFEKVYINRGELK